MLQQQVHGHQLDASSGGDGNNGVALRHGAAVDAEGLGDGGAGDVGVQNGDIVALPADSYRQLAGDHGFADAALAGHHAVDLTDAAAVAQWLDLEGTFVLAVCAVFGAAAAIVGAFAHSCFSFYAIYLQYTYNSSAPV